MVPPATCVRLQQELSHPFKSLHCIVASVRDLRAVPEVAAQQREGVMDWSPSVSVVTRACSPLQKGSIQQRAR